MIRIFFLTLDLAVAHAKDHGGWIAECVDGSFQWFDAAHYTLTPIIAQIHHHGGGKIGTWPHFDPAHEMHTLIESAKRRPDQRPLCHSA